MTFNSFTSKHLLSIVALALMSVSAKPAFSKGHDASRGFTVVAARALDNAKTPDLLLVRHQGRKQLLYLASANGKLAVFDVTQPAELREVNTWTLASSSSAVFRLQPVNDRFVVASDSNTNNKLVLLDLSDTASAAIARQFKDVDAYAVDDTNHVLYVAQSGELTVLRFDHPISRDAELFEESYEAR